MLPVNKTCCVFSAAVREREKLDAMLFPTFGYSLKVFISNVWLVIKWCFVQKGHSCCEFVWLLFAVRLLCVHVCTYELFRTVCIKTFEQIHSLWMDEKGFPADLWDTAIHHHQMAQFVVTAWMITNIQCLLNFSFGLSDSVAIVVWMPKNATHLLTITVFAIMVHLIVMFH